MSVLGLKSGYPNTDTGSAQKDRKPVLIPEENLSDWSRLDISEMYLKIR